MSAIRERMLLGRGCGAEPSALGCGAGGAAASSSYSRASSLATTGTGAGSGATDMALFILSRLCMAAGGGGMVNEADGGGMFAEVDGGGMFADADGGGMFAGAEGGGGTLNDATAYQTHQHTFINKVKTHSTFLNVFPITGMRSLLVLSSVSGTSAPNDSRGVTGCCF